MPRLLSFHSASLQREIIEEYINECDCVLFCGGEDLHPRFYRKEPERGIRKINLLRDEIEIEAMKLSYEQNKRVLAICRGIQVMNVAFGGTLKQDIDKEGYISHFQDMDGRFGYHTVEIKGKILKEIFKHEEILVNSFHHQAIETVAQGFLVEATAKDGVIEAISRHDRDFFVGVQWHPELMWKQDALQFELFKEFVKECAE
ncbi:gamma-glutamyl-gamma-aminobutyrate hydrolase family protein [Caldicellulosiruptor naganoensis]|uniref:Gamma-glutamyl-gamma-aminobutyrate hydrolase family protein n=1 Tax=Caldicellulosiruptor naganoensis TaxID=29324 RepID=A0ABY7BJI2_9FIRM|nr:gamma-glutamyl-gamma-aminobutyrate hydrolase family protein [Caldicellulosiruptor naganoensis]WAM31201.1 gamma-glutamyl-gamma-aminobutyrate hydrolase family protein [Caldicellulosiruptor naganoensis]